MPRLLLVDDNPDLLDTLVHVMSLFGWDVTACRDGAEAWDRLCEGPTPDAVLTDVRMPRVNGIELLSRVRERFPNLPVVILTANGDRFTRSRASALGARRVLDKPYPAHALDQVLRAVLAEAGAAATSAPGARARAATGPQRT